MKRYPVFLVVILVAISLLITPPYSYGDESVSLDIQVVYASSNKAYVDPTLVSLKEKLTKLFNYSSFEIISKVKKDAKKGEPALFDIPGGRGMEIIPVEIDSAKVRLDAVIRGGKGVLIKTALKMERGSIVMVGGPEFKEGVLIILISAD